MTQFDQELDRSRSLYAAFVTQQAAELDLSVLTQLLAAMLRDTGLEVDAAGMADDGSGRIAMTDAVLRLRSNRDELLELRYFAMTDDCNQIAAKALLCKAIRMGLAIVDAEEICWGDSEARIDIATFREIFGAEAPRRITPRRVTSQAVQHRDHHESSKVVSFAAARSRKETRAEIEVLEGTLRASFLNEDAHIRPRMSRFVRGVHVAGLSGVFLTLEATAVAAQSLLAAVF